MVMFYLKLDRENETKEERRRPLFKELMKISDHRQIEFRIGSRKEDYSVNCSNEATANKFFDVARNPISSRL